MKKDPEGEGKKVKRSEERKNEYFAEWVEKRAKEEETDKRVRTERPEAKSDADVALRENPIPECPEDPEVPSEKRRRLESA